MPREKNPLQELCRLLANLGQTRDRVAETLRASGCRGFRYGGFPSPVIRYVFRRFDDGGLSLVYSAPLLKPAKLYLHRLDGKLEELPLPEPVAEFLALFDEGAYPDLDLGRTKVSGTF